MIDLCPPAFELELCWAILALCYYFLNVAIFFVGDEFEGIDPDGGILPGIIFEHGLENSYVLDFDVLDFFGGEVE